MESPEKEGRETGGMTRGGTACRETTPTSAWWRGRGEATSIFFPSFVFLHLTRMRVCLWLGSCWISDNGYYCDLGNRRMGKGTQDFSSAMGIPMERLGKGDFIFTTRKLPQKSFSSSGVCRQLRCFVKNALPADAQCEKGLEARGTQDGRLWTVAMYLLTRLPVSNKSRRSSQSR